MTRAIEYHALTMNLRLESLRRLKGGYWDRRRTIIPLRRVNIVGCKIVSGGGEDGVSVDCTQAVLKHEQN